MLCIERALVILRGLFNHMVLANVYLSAPLTITPLEPNCAARHHSINLRWQ
jgi:hypothetical protein